MFNLILRNTGMVELQLRMYVNMGPHYTLLLCKGPITPSCVSTACSRHCKIHRIAVESQEIFKKKCMKLWKSEDVTASWPRLRNVYKQVIKTSDLFCQCGDTILRRRYWSPQRYIYNIQTYCIHSSMIPRGLCIIIQQCSLAS